MSRKNTDITFSSLFEFNLLDPVLWKNGGVARKYDTAARSAIINALEKLEEHLSCIDEYEGSHRDMGAIVLTPLMHASRHIPNEDEFKKLLNIIYSDNRKMYDMIEHAYEIATRRIYTDEGLWKLVNPSQSNKTVVPHRPAPEPPKRHLNPLKLFAYAAAASVVAAPVIADNLDNDNDNDGISDDMEISLGTNPDKPTFILEVDVAEGGHPVPINNVHDYKNIENYESDKLYNPRVPFIRTETIAYLTDLFESNGIEFVFDNNSSFHGNANGGGQKIPLPIVDKKCVIERKTYDQYLVHDMDLCASHNTISGEIVYHKIMAQLEDGASLWMSKSKKSDIYNNHNFFDPSRRDVFHYMIFTPEMTVENNGRVVGGLGSTGGSTSVVAQQNDWCKDAAFMLHELGHNFRFKHSDDPKDVMYENPIAGTCVAPDYSSSQWKSIKNGGLQVSLGKGNVYTYMMRNLLTRG